MDIGIFAMNHKRCFKPAGQSGKGYRIVSGLSGDILNRNLAATDPQVYPILVRRIVWAEKVILLIRPILV